MVSFLDGLDWLRGEKGLLISLLAFLFPVGIFSTEISIFFQKGGFSVLDPAFDDNMVAETLVMEWKDEPQLIRAAQRRDPSAFAVLVQRYHADVRVYLAVRLQNAHDAEDLAQEVFLTAFRKIGDCDSQRSIRPWLRGIAVKLLANFRRKNRPYLVGSHDELQALLDASLEEQMGHLDQEGSAMEALVECLEKLGNPAKKLLWARYEDGESLEDLSARLGRKASAISM